MPRGHAEALMPLIARVMDRRAIDFSALDRIAVTVGPGSFTGLRVGIAAARGIALAADKPAVGLTTLAAYAAPLYRRGRHAAGHRRDRCPPRPCVLAGVRPSGRTLVGAGIATLREAVRARRPVQAALSARRRSLLAAAWPAGERPPLDVDAARRARHRHGWRGSGAAASDTDTPPKPLYLRAPDAQPQDAARLARR